VAGIYTVLLDPQLAPRGQTAWAFTQADDARAVAGFLNNQLGAGEEIAWVEFVPVARRLNVKVLEYLDTWAQVAEEMFLEEE
jgi:hypothetical protein